MNSTAGDEFYVEETVLMMNECRKVPLELFNKRFSNLENSELKSISFLDSRVARRMPHLTPHGIPHAFNMNDHISKPDEIEQQSDLENQCQEELQMYMADVNKSVMSTTDPFEWIHKNVYPNLSKVARKLLGAVATIVPSDQTFSTSGNVVTVL
ncbi:LOW QUALITY PROTEIN: hypothetical protein PHPALM_31251 [Phytophthora palmivora]|uniref:HAT C-terminal dimerisation domain-containing protein n=1 Tax=Phytophthora palmivora TaxID=4796 RepID=A0A2P4X337_9STRA|nr:LOW QUALITY PROTEIN: hypothetical protein PHPALM_31251 [Phytophthora palmivora]